MIGRFETWRRRLWLWAPPLVFCLLNLSVFVTYFSFFSGKVEDLQKVHDQAAAELEALEKERRENQAFLERARGGSTLVKGLYQHQFATEAERFTRAVAQVRQLARDAGLNPTAYSYPTTELEDYDLVKRSFVFRVQGTYEQLRTFINFLELSEQFLTLEGVTLDDASGSTRNAQLNISLTLSTIFVTEDAPSVVEPQVPTS